MAVILDMANGKTEFTPPETYSILSPEGVADEKEMPEIHDVTIKKMYESMVYARLLDTTILKLQREGRCGTYASSLGEEATQVGSSITLKQTDWLFPYFREIGAHIIRGLPMNLYLLYWMGNEMGSRIPEDINDFPVSVPVGSQIPHAAGAGMAAKFKKDGNVVMCYMGDGATSEGDFHEGMNFAGTFKAPVVFICQNNQWAISIPSSKQTASQTFAQKAIAYGFEGVKVDGNDVFAVYKVVKEAVEKARRGEGPTFIECVTYRMSDHTTADDAKKYRPLDDIEKWKKKDPIDRLKKYMTSKKLWDEDYEKTILEKINKQIEEDVKKAEEYPAPKPSEMFDYLYSEIPKPLAEQKKSAEEFFADKNGGDKK